MNAYYIPETLHILSPVLSVIPQARDYIYFKDKSPEAQRIITQGLKAGK